MKVAMRSVIACFASALLFAAASPSLSAFPQAGNPDSHVCGTSITYGFVGVGWTPSLKAVVGSAFEEWNSPRSQDGSPYVSVTEEVDPAEEPEISVILDPNLPALGYGACGYNGGWGTFIVALNPNIASQSDAYITQVARHEFGHVLAAKHTGISDDYTASSQIPSTVPTMYHCVLTPSVVESADLFQDDEGQLANETWQKTTPPPLSPNGSFENSVTRQYWGNSGGSWATVTGSSADGSYHLRWTPGTDSDYLYMTMAWATGADFSSIPAEVDALGRFRRESSAHSGDIVIQVWRRFRDYNDIGPGGCYFEIGVDLNQPNGQPSSSAWVKEVKKRKVPGLTWTTYVTPTYTVNNGTDGVDLQFRVRSFVVSGSTPAPVRVDNVRLRER